ncbi:hypothetical protein, variant 2 [Fonticula alba]|uniref:Uncharacterized protein n=1 Tax=Fonticula alba TaxID=691883 RepID=A0A058Z6C9_FONAL|nr:hypothetical protein, variant 2 [Fonticula alba]KCV69072.1 hypothetical protein, variant 2 [Fonticula alba]|eukprot:XP_009496643.1 hypothetical protein, variant 2 [Fonticula alba]
MGSCGHLRPPGPRRKSRRFAPSSCAGSPHSPSQRVWIPPCACRPHRPPTWPSARGGSLFDMSTVAHTPADLIIRYLPFGQPNEHAPRQYTGVYGRRLAPGESLLVPRTGRPYPGFGPGGRAVHKANSNVEVRLPLDKVAWLPKSPSGSMGPSSWWSFRTTATSRQPISTNAWRRSSGLSRQQPFCPTGRATPLDRR